MANELDTTVALFFEAGRKIKRCINRDSEALSLTQSEVLRFVEERKNPTMRDVAKHLQITAPSATSIIAELVVEKYLTRQDNPSDRREVQLLLTAQGKKILAATVAKRKKALRTLLLHLSTSDRADLRRILSQIIKE